MDFLADRHFSVFSEQVHACQVGRVACLLLGGFVGGGLHCKLSGGSSHSNPSIVLASIIVDAGQYHFSDPFTGNLVSIMAYNHVMSGHKSSQVSFTR